MTLKRRIRSGTSTTSKAALKSRLKSIAKFGASSNSLTSKFPDVRLHVLNNKIHLKSINLGIDCIKKMQSYNIKLVILTLYFGYLVT